MPEEAGTNNSEDPTAGGTNNTAGGNGEGGSAGQTAAGTSGDQTTPQTWEELLDTLPDDQRTLYDEHTRGLRSALDDERRQRKDLAKQLRDAAAAAEEGSQARETLESLQTQLDEAAQRADFAEDAVQQGVTNPRLAWLAAKQIDAFKRNGSADWEALKEAFPELFRKTVAPPANAGAGTDSQPAGALSMNQLIRQAAGRQG